MRRHVVAMIDAYRRHVSPLLPPLCRFHPSCSAYAREAVQVHGAAKGALLALLRLVRCNPACRGGDNPVPVPGRWRA